MKRWLLFIGLGILSLVGGLIAAVYLLVDRAAVRELVVDQATSALGRRVQLGELDLVVLPQPAVRLESLSVSGDAGAPELLTADAISLRVALWPLLLERKVELASVTLERPAIRLPVDAEGMPVIPELAPPSEGAGIPADRSRSRVESPEGASGGDPADSKAESGGSIRLAIDQLELTDGSLEAGEWKLAGLDISGELDLEGESRFRGSASLPGLGQLREIEVRLRGLGEDVPQVDVRIGLGEFSLKVLGDRLGLVPDPIASLAGELSGDLEASLAGAELTTARGNLEVVSAEIAASGARVAGPLPVQFELGGPFSLDLTAAEVAFESTLTKPAGERLRVDGTLTKELGPALVRDVRLGVGPNDIPLKLELAKQRLAVSPCSIELEPIAPWVDLGGRTLAGSIRIEKPLAVALEPLGIRGRADLDRVRVPLERGDASLSGPIIAEGKRVRFDQLSAAVGEQVAKLQGSYDLEAGRVEMDLGMQKVDIDQLITVATGRSQFAGVLGADLSLRGAPTLEEIEGVGSFSISPGQLRGFSLVRQVLGPLGEVASQVLRAKGKDLSRYEDENFERLEGKVQLGKGRLKVERLLLQYRYGSAELRGNVELIGEQRLDLVGTITLPAEVAADAIGTATDQPFVLSDVPIGGTLEEPRVRLDAGLLAQLVGKFAARKALGQKLEEKLKERLGSDEDVEAVKGLLEGVLGGRRK